MLALDQIITRRRPVLLGVLAIAAASACGRIPQRPAQAEATPASTPQLDAWRTEALSILHEGLDTLRTFEVFAAYRVSTTPGSDRRSTSELVWDPPSGAEWDAATHGARGLHGRAEQFFQLITAAPVDASAWREQRELAEIARGLVDLGDALAAYRDRVDRLPSGDASGATPLLDAAWTSWEQLASQLDLARAEPIGCGG